MILKLKRSPLDGSTIEVDTAKIETLQMLVTPISKMRFTEVFDSNPHRVSDKSLRVGETIDDMFEQAYQAGYEKCEADKRAAVQELYQEGFNEGVAHEKEKALKNNELPKGWFEVVADDREKKGVLRNTIKADSVVCINEFELFDGDMVVSIILNSRAVISSKEPYEAVMRKFTKALKETE